MKVILPILVFFFLASCKQKESNKSPEQLELILLGFFEKIDTNDFSKLKSDLSKFGAQKYFLYKCTDSLTVKSCSYLNDFGEPVLPVTCNYYKKPISPYMKSQFDSIVQSSYKILENDFIKRRPKNPVIVKYTKPEEKDSQ